MPALRKIVSGGQTGVDRAGLDIARELGIASGGWVPRGRRAEDGLVPAKYPNMVEAPSKSDLWRTRRNVMDADATLIVARGPLEGGSLQTAVYAEQYGKPYLVVDLLLDRTPEKVLDWLRTVQPGILNVAGPRESKAPLIQEEARRFLLPAFRQIPCERPLRQGFLF
ncbi:MAG: putative molybdenum carrier protein [Kiritimatiellia bacterium]